MISSRCTIPENIPTLGVEVKLSQTPGSPRTPPIDFSENARDVLVELGYSVKPIFKTNVV